MYSLLLFDRDARGMTPFMLAVSGRAYPAAITVLEAAQKMATGRLRSHLSVVNWFVFEGRLLGFQTCIEMPTNSNAHSTDVCMNNHTPLSKGEKTAQLV